MSGKATLFRFKFLSSYPKFFLLIFLVFLLLGQSINLSAQVIIKERVSIYPNSIPPITPDGVISGDPNNPVYLRYGGNMVLRLSWPYSQVTNWHDTRLGEETLGEIARNLIQGDSVMIGPFPQWQKLQFWVTDSLRLPDMEREKVYPSNSSSEIIDAGNYGETVDFQLPKVNPADTIVTEMSWSIKVKKNDNLAAMPPPEILSYYGNPFVASEEIEIPADGMVYMILENLSSTAMVDLYQESPAGQLLLSDLRHQFGHVVDLGRKNAGDLLRFYITSSHSIVAGQNLYPKTIDDTFFLYWDRSIRFKNLYFEDWTDLLFDNFYFALYIVPDHLGDFPWPMQVQFNPAMLAPGDTADIVLRKRNENGSLETFPDSTLFDVQLLDSFQYGTIYSPDLEDTSDFFFGLPQGFQFIARDSLNNDSVFVPVIVNTSGGIITAAPLINPGVGYKIKDQRLKKKEEMRSRIVRADEEQRNRKSLRFSEKRSVVEGVSAGANANPVIEGVGFGDYSMGIGEVFIAEEKPLEIMLGETKYFQARIDPSDTTRLLIEERNDPTLTSDGINEDVWGNEPLEIITGDTTYGKRLGVYWETEKPIINGANLPKGLIRLVGRYWHEDSTYKVKLTANYHGKTASIKIKVIKPTKLGSSYGNSVDVFNMDFNLDSTCVVWGGLFGIPPHFLKGHIHHEANLHNGKFKPTYVYEPYTTQFSDSVITRTQNPFFVDSVSMGSGACVPNSNSCITHQNVRRYAYPTEPQTVWDVVSNYSQLVSYPSPGGYSLYGTRQGGEDGPMYFYGSYKIPQSEYNDYLRYFNRELDVEHYPERQKQANNRARDSLVVFLRDQWDGGIKGGTKGLNNIAAQTRIAASYGLFQVLYTTAITLKRQPYPENANNRPEDLNTTDSTFAVALRMQKNYLINKLGLNVYTNGNWPKGLEQTFMEAVWGLWNTRENYPSEVFQFTLQYLPSR